MTEPDRLGLSIISTQGRTIDLELFDVSEDGEPRRKATTKSRKKKSEEIQQRTRFDKWITTENFVLGLCLIIYMGLALSQSSYPRSLRDWFASSTRFNTMRSEDPFGTHPVKDLIKVTEQWSTTIDSSGQSEALPYTLRGAVLNLNNVGYVKPPRDFPSQREFHGKLFSFTSDVGSASSDFRYFDQLRMAAFRNVSLGLDNYYWALLDLDHAIKRHRRSLRGLFDRTTAHEVLQKAHGATLPFIDTMLVKLNTTLLPRGTAVSSTWRTLQGDLAKIQILCESYARGIAKPNEACRWTPAILRGDKQRREYERKIEWVRNQSLAFHVFDSVCSLPVRIVDEAITQYQGMERDLQTLRRRIVELRARDTFDATTIIHTVTYIESMMSRFKAAKNEANANSIRVVQQMNNIDPAGIVVDTELG